MSDRKADLRDIVATVFETDISDDHSGHFSDFATADSLKQVEIFFAVEKHFGIRFTNEEVGSIKDIDGLCDAVERHLAR